MDAITQVVLGAAIGEAGFRRSLGGKAVVVGGLAGLLPDFDIFAAAVGPWASILYHRGITHSLIFAPLVAPLLGYLAWLWARKKGSSLAWAHLCFWGLITHPLLDLFTSYGTQLFYPFSDRRFALDGVSVVDLAYTLPLALALYLGQRYKDRPLVGRRAAQITLALTTLYLAFGTWLSHQAITYASRQLQAEGFQIAKIRAFPTLLQLGAWRIVAQDRDGHLRIGMHSALWPTPIAFFKKIRPPDPRIDEIFKQPHGKILRWFSDGLQSYRIQTSEAGTSLFLEDQRYAFFSQPDQALWGGRADFDPQGRLLRIVRYGNPGRKLPDLSEEIAALFRTLRGTSLPQPSSSPAPASRPRR